jgi:hypothetical protein
VDPDGRSVDEAGKNCCPWPPLPYLGDWASSMESMFDNLLDLDFNINISLPLLNNGGGAEGYGDGSKNIGRKGTANMSPIDFSELPSPFMRAKIRTDKFGPFIAGFKNGVTLFDNTKKAVDKTNDYLNNKRKTFEDYVPTGEMKYLSNNRPNSPGAYEIDFKLTVFEYSNSEDSLEIRQQNDQLTEYYEQKAYDKLDSISKKK